jgi:hypothetical protein
LDTQLRARLLAWPKVARNFYVYEYYTIGEALKRWSMVAMICEDMRYFHKLGIQGISSDQWGPGWYPLNMYAFAKLGWNPALTPDEIIHDFCTKHYGRAAESMEALLERAGRGLAGVVDHLDPDRLARRKTA